MDWPQHPCFDEMSNLISSLMLIFIPFCCISTIYPKMILVSDVLDACYPNPILSWTITYLYSQQPSLYFNISRPAQRYMLLNIVTFVSL